MPTQLVTPEEADLYDEIVVPPAPHDLEDWLIAVLAGDAAAALALVNRVFDDDASRAICERLLRTSARGPV